MKKILIIVGNSGAGKSTLAREYLQHNDYPLLTFREVGRKLAVKNGFTGIGEYFDGTDLMVFKRDLGRELLKEISDKMLITDFLVIEGLIFCDIVLAVKNKYKNVLVVNIDVPYEIRIKRIAQKLSTTLEGAIENEDNKAKLKLALGMDNVLNAADFTLDGRKSVQMLVDELIELVHGKGTYKNV